MYSGVHFNFIENNRIYSVLGSGESITWMGRPSTIKLLLILIPFLLFSVYWTYSSVMWIYHASGKRVSDFGEFEAYFALFGVPFVLIGLVLILCSVWMFVKIKKLIYVITDQRFIVINGDQVHTVSIDRMRAMGRTGNHQLGQEINNRYTNRGFSFAEDENLSKLIVASFIIGFLTLPDFKHVKDIVGRMKKSE